MDKKREKGNSEKFYEFNPEKNTKKGPKKQRKIEDIQNLKKSTFS